MEAKGLHPAIVSSFYIINVSIILLTWALSRVSQIAIPTLYGHCECGRSAVRAKESYETIEMSSSCRVQCHRMLPQVPAE